MSFCRKGIPLPDQIQNPVKSDVQVEVFANQKKEKRASSTHHPFSWFGFVIDTLPVFFIIKPFICHLHR